MPKNCVAIINEKEIQNQIPCPMRPAAGNSSSAREHAQAQACGLYKDTPPDLLDLPIERYTVENNTLTVYYDSSIIRSKDLTDYLLTHGEAMDILIRKPAV